MKWKYISSLKSRIYPQRFSNAPAALTWSLVLQTRNLANKSEDFSKCDEFIGEISQLTDTEHVMQLSNLYWTLKKKSTYGY
jgi:capsule polysaccharide export protein KpsE/RkpR